MANARYDVAIIGGGISGLVAGAYLAMAGVKVVIVEKYKRVGGCCASFSRGPYVFDVGVHYFGSLAEGGVLRQVFRDLGLEDRLNIIRFNPNDVLVTPNHRIRIFNDLQDTISDFSKNFPAEASNVANFFKWVVQEDPAKIYMKARELTFRVLLDSYFSDEHLKQILTMPLGNIGLPSTSACALTAVILYRAYMLDGGFYPIGGVQELPDQLAKKIIEAGGEILTEKQVMKIQVNKRIADSVMLNDGSELKAKYFISACDARQTLLNMIGAEHVPGEIISKVANLRPSMSAVVLYLGLSKSLKNSFKEHCSHWISPNYGVDMFYEGIQAGCNPTEELHGLVSFASFHDNALAPAGGETISIFSGAPYMDKAYWKDNKDRTINLLLNMGEILIPNLRSLVSVQELATPVTVFNFTGNSLGSLYGWASTVDQVKKSTMPIECSFIKNLYQVGHWATQGYAQGGVPVVALAGKQAALSILKKERLNSGMVLKQ